MVFWRVLRRFTLFTAWGPPGYYYNEAVQKYQETLFEFYLCILFSSFRRLILKSSARSLYSSVHVETKSPAYIVLKMKSKKPARAKTIKLTLEVFGSNQRYPWKTSWPSCLYHCLHSLFCSNSFYFTHAHCGCQACALAFSDVIILTHMDFDIQVDNLGCDSRLFYSASHTALTSPLRDRVLASWSPMGLGVSSRRRNRLYSEGELVNVLPEKGKEDCRNP